MPPDEPPTNIRPDRSKAVWNDTPLTNNVRVGLGHKAEAPVSWDQQGLKDSSRGLKVFTFLTATILLIVLAGGAYVFFIKGRLSSAASATQRDSASSTKELPLSESEKESNNTLKSLRNRPEIT